MIPVQMLWLAVIATAGFLYAIFIFFEPRTKVMPQEVGPINRSLNDLDAAHLDAQKKAAAADQAHQAVDAAKKAAADADQASDAAAAAVDTKREAHFTLLNSRYPRRMAPQASPTVAPAATPAAPAPPTAPAAQAQASGNLDSTVAVSPTTSPTGA